MDQHVFTFADRSPDKVQSFFEIQVQFGAWLIGDWDYFVGEVIGELRRQALAHSEDMRNVQRLKHL